MHDEKGRLIEDYWEAEWPKVETDFRAMRRMGANVVRVHLQLGKFMTDHKFGNLREFIGTSLPYFTTHHDLVDRQKASREAKEAKRTGRDVETWKGDIAKETSTLVTN